MGARIPGAPHHQTENNRAAARAREDSGKGRRCMAIFSWEQIDISASRRPLLLPGEAILHVQSNVGIYSGKHKLSDYQNGVIYLTGHRICYVDAAKPALNSLALDLGRIDKAGFLKSSPKVIIRCVSDHSSSEASGQSTPLPAALASSLQKSSGDWICPICTFTNALSPGFVAGSQLPTCANCGMKPPKSTKILNGHTSLQVPRRRDGDGTPKTETAKLQQPIPITTQGGLTFPCPRCTFGNHPAITTCELCGAPLISRNLPPVLNSNDNTDERGPSPALIDSASVPDDATCKLSFRSAGDKAFLEKLRRAISDRGWDQGPPLAPAQDTTIGTSGRRGAGIGALQSREESIRVQNADTMSGAFEDLEGLMARAKEMIELAESFAKRMSSAPSSVGATEARSLILESSAALGLSSSVVTKETAGKSGVYHAELARQLSEFLEGNVLRKEGGAMTLVDLYAIYNRARKGNLVSPDDLHAACQLLDTLKLPIKLRKFRSGIVVVQDRSRTDESTRRAVVQWIQSRTTGASALDAVEMFGWSVSVAKEELEMVEESGDIVRDVGVEGTRFYDNEIRKWDLAAWLQRFSVEDESSSST